MNYIDQEIERIYVDNPGTDYAQWRAELETGGAARAGKVEVMRRLSTIVGGFHKFKGTEAQNQAVSILKTAWERAVVGGARAIDPSVEPVDGGYRNPEAVFEHGVDARKLKASIERELGADDTERLVMVAVAGYGPTAYAKWRWPAHSKPNHHYISVGTKEVLVIADRLAVFLKLQGRGGERN